MAIYSLKSSTNILNSDFLAEKAVGLSTWMIIFAVREFLRLAEWKKEELFSLSDFCQVFLHTYVHLRKETDGSDKQHLEDELKPDRKKVKKECDYKKRNFYFVRKWPTDHADCIHGMDALLAARKYGFTMNVRRQQQLCTCSAFLSLLFNRKACILLSLALSAQDILLYFVQGSYNYYKQDNNIYSSSRSCSFLPSFLACFLPSVQSPSEGQIEIKWSRKRSKWKSKTNFCQDFWKRSNLAIAASGVKSTNFGRPPPSHSRRTGQRERDQERISFHSFFVAIASFRVVDKRLFYSLCDACFEKVFWLYLFLRERKTRLIRTKNFEWVREIERRTLSRQQCSAPLPPPTRST